jgi:AcrR family transcriptional regulator
MYGAQEATVVPARARARPAASRSGLTHEQVAAAALELVDRDGPEALSMRRLADHLGVGTMTLYGYFRSKDELLDAVLDLAVGDLPPLPRRGSPRRQLRALALAFHRNLARHPGVVRVRIERPLLRPEQLRVTERALELLVEAGFSPAEAPRAFRVLFVYVFGYATFNPPDAGGAGADPGRAAIASLPQAEYPLLTSHVEELAATLSGEEQFLYGLDALLDGLEARLPG